MTVYGEQADKTIQEILARIYEQIPEIGALLTQGKDEHWDESQTLAAVMQHLATHPGLSRKLETLVEEALVGTPNTMPLQEIPGSNLMQPPPGSPGLPRLNPLYEAALQERIQFDGDIPELRTGYMPKNATPAVPVDTDSRNPVALGWMLSKASNEVVEDLQALESKRQLALAQHVAEETTDLAPLDKGLLALSDRNTLPDPTGYQRGALPALRRVEEPSGSMLLALSTKQRHEYAWKFISTTQGRRSAVPVLEKELAQILRAKGFQVTLDSKHRGEDVPVLAGGEWCIDISGGPNSSQPNFSYLDTALAVLCAKLMGGLEPQDVVLSVTVINKLDQRRVGWAAQLFTQDVE